MNKSQLKPLFIGVSSVLVLVLPSFYALSQWVLTALLDKLTFWRELPMLLLPFVYFALFRDERPRWRRFPILAFGAIVLVGMAQLTFGSVAPAVMLRGLVAYFLLFWSMLFFMSIKVHHLMLFALGSTVLCLIGGIGVIVDQQTEYFRYVTNYGSVEERLASLATEGYRPSFMFEAATMGAFTLTLASGLQFYVFRYFRQKWLRIFCVLSVVASVTAVILSLARVGYGGLAIIAAGFACAMVLAGQVRYLLGALGLAGAAMALVVLVNGGASDLSLRFQRTFTDEAADEASNNERVDSWESGLDALRKNALLGAGIGTGQARAMQGAPFHYESSILAVFNEGGIVVFALYAAVLLAPLCWLAQGLLQARALDLKVYSIFFLLGLIAMSFINPIFSLPDYSIYLGFIYALMARVVCPNAFAPDEPPQRLSASDLKIEFAGSGGNAPEAAKP